MLRIGITGGIGSGKSTVARIFSALGIPVYNADSASKRIMTEDQALKREIMNLFGSESYIGNELNRKYLAAQVFNNSSRMALLNSLVHPATLKDAADWMEKQHAPYSVKEAALLFESGADRFLDQVIGLKSPHSLRVKRTMERDGLSAAEVEARIALQMDEDEKMSLCDHIIINDEQHMIIPQVLFLHNQFLKSVS